MEYYDLLEELQDQFEMSKLRNKRLELEIKVLRDRLKRIKEYAEYMEDSSISTDDQPRPAGWDYV